MSIEMKTAIASNMATNNNKGYDYVDNQSEDKVTELSTEEQYAPIPLENKGAVEEATNNSEEEATLV